MDWIRASGLQIRSVMHVNAWKYNAMIDEMGLGMGMGMGMAMDGDGDGNGWKDGRVEIIRWDPFFVSFDLDWIALDCIALHLL